MTDAKFPEPQPDDTEEVAALLTTGSALWLDGEQAEAVRWLRKAQESADAAQNDERSLELARRAAELAELTETEASETPPPADDHPPQLTKPPMPPANHHETLHSSANGHSNGAGVDHGDGHSSEAGGQAPVLGPVLTQALRVCIKRSVRDGELFVARLLEDGEIPEGYSEALVVLTDPDQDLLDKLS
jgi:hypothetical protein